MQYFVETVTGEKLIGEIVEPTEHLFNHMNVSEENFKDGIWLKRKKHVSYISYSIIKIKRPATVIDRET